LGGAHSEGRKSIIGKIEPSYISPASLLDILSNLFILSFVVMP
jgi:hypothetical protein